MAAVHPDVRRRLVDCLAHLGAAFRTVTPAGIAAGVPAGTVACVCSQSVAAVRQLPRATVVVLAGVQVPDRVAERVVASRAVVIDINDLTPATLLDAMVRATSGLREAGLWAYLSGVAGFQALPPKLIEAFVKAPLRLRRLGDVCRVLGLSRKAARVLLRGAGFGRAEHLSTALRREAWFWFERQRVRRDAFEKYLGIGRRDSYRRSCSRAGLRVPWDEGSRT